jgi:hypothetical protein
LFDIFEKEKGGGEKGKKAFMQRVRRARKEKLVE